jgi:hypothetical protein
MQDKVRWWEKLDGFDWATAPVSLSAGTAALVFSLYNKMPTGGLRWWFAGPQVALTLLAAAVPVATAIRAKLREKRAQEREEAARQEVLLRTNKTLDPIVRVIAKAIATGNLSGLREQVLWLVLIATRETIGSRDKTRVCFFDYVAVPSERVVPTGFYVGGKEPRTEFVKGTVAGDHVIGMIRKNEPFTCEDIAKEAPPGWGDKVRAYQAFVSAPVAVGTVAYGLLSIDTLEVGDLKKRDEFPLMVLAGVLAVALGLDPAPTSPQQPTMGPPLGAVTERSAQPAGNSNTTTDAESVGGG